MSEANPSKDEIQDDQTVASLRSMQITSSEPRHPDLEDDIPLLESFHRAQTQYQQIQDSTQSSAEKQPQIQSCIAKFQKIADVVRAAGLFSLNEELDDINTVDLQYLTIPYYLADLLMQVQLIDNERTLVMRHRFAALLQAVVQLKKFLDHAETLKLMKSEETARYHRGGGHGDSRQSRIEAYKREQASRDLVQSLLAKRNASRNKNQMLSDDERENTDEERTYTLALITWYIQKSLDHLDMANREIPVIKHGLTQETNTDIQQQRITPTQLIQSSTSSSSQPSSRPKIYRIDNPQAVNNPIPAHMASMMHRVAAPVPPRQAQALLGPSTSTITPTSIPSSIDALANARANVRDNVFRDSNPYTLTVEQWAEQQHMQHHSSSSSQQGRVPIERARANETRIEHKSESDDDEPEESEAQQDAATLKARNWDNWKDEHEKGIGNRMK